jgi:hypothetical protein
MEENRETTRVIMMQNNNWQENIKKFQQHRHDVGDSCRQKDPNIRTKATRYI